MKKEEQALLILSARALSYPTEQWKIKMKEMNEVIEEIFPKRKGQRITNMYFRCCGQKSGNCSGYMWKPLI